MSTLLLIRHGQARAYEAESDRLSETGERQATRLGEYLLEEGVVFDAVCCGSLERQRRTLDVVGEVYRAANRPWPVPQVAKGWDEYDAPRILGTLLPALCAADPAVRALAEAFEREKGGGERNRYFQRLFEILMDAWEREELCVPDLESFADFHARVRASFDALVAEGGRGVVAVFTSGGPIGACVQSVLGAPMGAALRLNWRVKNASVTEFVFSKNRVSLEYFNSFSHLPPEMRTFR